MVRQYCSFARMNTRGLAANMLGCTCASQTVPDGIRQLHPYTSHHTGGRARLTHKGSDMTWKDIQTAPGFGSRVDLWANGERYTDCWWGFPTYGGRKGQYGWVHQSGYDCDGPVDDWVPNPTHWMPLPAPPGTPRERDPENQETGSD